MKEFNLSEKRTPVIANIKGKSKVMFYDYYEKDVKEFIRLLNKEFSPINNSRKFSQEEIKIIINNLAGEKLI